MGRLVSKLMEAAAAPKASVPGRQSLFAALNQDDQQALERLAQPHLLRRGQTLYLSTDLGKAVCLLKSGRLKIARLSKDGREFILEIVEPGTLFGHLSVPEGSAPETLAEAFEDSLVLALPRAEFEAFLRSRPELGVAVVRHIDRRLRAMESRIEDLVFRDIPGRLASALLRLADAYGMATDGGVAVGFRITQQELANLIGASREMVNHTLSHWKREGLIELHGRSIVLRRRKVLEAQGVSR